VLIEHNVPFVMSVSTHVVVMHFGKVVATGTPEGVANDPVVQEIYLGE
jgi:branched-chain amino acid transport system ATP-binding protein